MHREEWTGEVVGKLHVLGVKKKDLAEVCGYTPEYLTMVLNGNAKFSTEYSKNRTKKKIYYAVRILEERIKIQENGY